MMKKAILLFSIILIVCNGDHQLPEQTQTESRLILTRISDYQADLRLINLEPETEYEIIFLNDTLKIKTLSMGMFPKRPEIVFIKPDFDEITLCWNRIDTAKFYYVYRDDVFIANIIDTCYTDIDLISDSTYTYAICSVNPWGVSIPTYISVKTRGAFRAIWNRSKDYIFGDIEHGYAEEYILFADDKQIYCGVDTFYYFTIDSSACFYVKAIDVVGNISDSVEVRCIDD